MNEPATGGDSWHKSDTAVSRNVLAQHIKPDHKRMSRMLGYSLLRGTPDAWVDFSIVARARLSIVERAGLAVASLRSLPDVLALDTAAAAIGMAGDPLPPFLGGMEDARSWASWASPVELKAYALAAFEAMSAKDKAAFFHHISTIEVKA